MGKSIRLMNRLNKTESAVFYCRFSLFLRNPVFFSDYLEVTTAVVVSRGVGKTSPRTSIFHILVLQEYWVQTESRIPLKPVLGGARIVALSISSHEQTQ